MDQKLNSTDRPIALYYTWLTNVNSFSIIDGSHCSLTINGEWNYIHTSIGSLDLQEKPVTNSPGTKFTSQLSAVCPGHEDTTPEDISSISGRKAIFKVVYRSGKEKIIGNKTSGPRPVLRILSNDVTQRIIEFSWESITPNRWLI